MTRELIHVPIIPKNYPQGYEEKPWCPYTPLIDICTQLTGYETYPERFCGEIVTDARRSNGAIHWLEAASYFPITSCLEVNKALQTQMTIVDGKMEKPDQSEIEGLLKSDAPFDKKTNAVTNYNRNMNNYNKRRAIISRWRQIIYETSIGTSSDEKNPHFRQVSSPEDLTDEEIIGKVKLFTKALEGITGGYKEGLVIGDGGAANCIQSPKAHSFGKI